MHASFPRAQRGPFGASLCCLYHCELEELFLCKDDSTLLRLVRKRRDASGGALLHPLCQVGWSFMMPLQPCSAHSTGGMQSEVIYHTKFYPKVVGFSVWKSATGRFSPDCQPDKPTTP